APGGRRVLYRRPFLAGSTLYLLASDLEDAPAVEVNRAYLRFVHYRFMNLHSVAHVLTDLVCLLLLRRGLCPLYCSAFRLRHSTVVVFAPSNTGKTLTTLRACLEHGAEFLAEDLAISDGRQVFAVPWTSTFRSAHPGASAHVEHALGVARRGLPLLAPLIARSAASITDYLPYSRICHRSPATHLVILERGASRVSSLSPEAALRKVGNLNRAQLSYGGSPLNNAYEYFNPGLDIGGAFQTEYAILHQLVDAVEERVLVRAEDAANYLHLVLQAVR
ncbi:MAG: hypothetical protein QME94_15740, partial [Anaerolineae bacterium]|nr:hypothetical protein [Anaerolineae bacterium]